MFRQRLVTNMDATNNGFFFVFEYGIIRSQEPNPIEFIIHKASSKFIFSDHKANTLNTWVYLLEKPKADIFITVQRIADSEGYGELLGYYEIDQNTKSPNFKPVDGLLPSQASEKLKKGISDVESGKWKSKIESA